MDQETEGKRIIEVGGVKMEIDLRHAKVVENFKIGDNVKLLKKSYGDTFNSYPGVIVSFDNFKERPTIIVAYLEETWQGGVKLAYINRDSKDFELCLMSRDEMVIDKVSVLDQFDRQIAGKERELADLKSQKTYFLERFNRYFETGEAIERALGSR